MKYLCPYSFLYLNGLLYAVLRKKLPIHREPALSLGETRQSSEETPGHPQVADRPSNVEEEEVSKIWTHRNRVNPGTN